MEELVRLSGFWENRRVLLTGHTGFKGSWLCLWLEALGAEVIGMSQRPHTKPNLFTVLSPWPSVKSHIGDLRDASWVERVVREAEPEIAIHLAAQALVRRSYAEPAMTFDTNVMGTVNLLEAARGASGMKAILVVTSDKVYQNSGDGVPFSEQDCLGGRDPYSASKACADLVAHAYAASYWSEGRPRLGTARAGNVIGGGDWSDDRLLPDVIRAFAGGTPAIVRNPDAVRPWQHVLDVLSGYLTYSELLATGSKDLPRALNFGPEANDSRPVSWMVDQVIEEWGDGSSWEVHHGPKVSEAPALTLTSRLARETVKWLPKLQVSDALSWTVAWYRAYADGQDMRAFSRNQIERYDQLPAEPC